LIFKHKLTLLLWRFKYGYSTSKSPTSMKTSKIQMYGLDEHRTTYSIMVHNFTPFVYIKVSNDWNKYKTDEFIEHLKQHPNKSIAYGSKDIVSYEWVKKNHYMDLMPINIIISYIFLVKICLSCISYGRFIMKKIRNN